MFGTRVTWLLKTSTSSVDPIRIYPGLDYKENDHKRKTFRSTQGGRLHTFSLVGSYQEFQLPLSFVNCADATVINSWWESQAQLHLTINGSVDSSIYNFDTISNLTVLIINSTKPFDENSEIQYSKFNGQVILRTI